LFYSTAANTGNIADWWMEGLESLQKYKYFFLREQQYEYYDWRLQIVLSLCSMEKHQPVCVDVLPGRAGNHSENVTLHCLP
jgi:hypothetical protein